MIVSSFNSLSNLASNSSQILNPFIKLKEHYLKIYHSGLSQAYPNPNILNDAVPQRRRAQVCHPLYLLHLRSRSTHISWTILSDLFWNFVLWLFHLQGLDVTHYWTNTFMADEHILKLDFLILAFLIFLSAFISWR